MQIVIPDKNWIAICADETEAIRTALAPQRVFIDHVGSTAVHGLAGKPSIDLLVSMIDWSEAEQSLEELIRIGYIERERCALPPRYYLIKTVPDKPDFHIHLVPNGSAWGQDMIAFRDALAADSDLSQRYTVLKRKLAAVHPHDIQAYTAGKAAFVAGALQKTAGSFSNDRLLTHQRAELDRAQLYQNLALGNQVCLAGVAAASVYSNNNVVLLNMALIGFALAGTWFFLTRMQRKHRSAGDQARRTVLLASGLESRFSAEQHLRIFDGFSVKIDGKPIMREESYFASRAGPGFGRLAELIEESAYWTRDLQRASATTMRVVLVIASLLAAASLWRTAPSMTSDTAVSLARVFIAVLVFLLSSDAIGTMIAHRDAADTIGELLQRVESAAARGYPDSDVLLLLSDYNGAVESAPGTLPGIFKIRQRSLTRQWRAYLENKRSSAKSHRVR